jgi:NADH dehydrogenase/NADH:ubiquinone oxidoreductase subunit G
MADLASAQSILVVGSDPEVDAPVLLPPIYQAKKHGAAVLYAGKVAKLPRFTDVHATPGNLLEFLAEVARKAFPAQAGAMGLPHPNLPAPEARLAHEMGERIARGRLAVVFGPQIAGPDGARTVALLAAMASHANGALLPAWDGGNVQGMLDLGISGSAPGKLKALYLTQPIEKIPEGVELVILQDIYRSDLMDRAEVVLPASAFTETDGTATSLERRVQRVVKCAGLPKMAQEDWAIISRLATAMGGQGFGFASAKEVTDEMVKAHPAMKPGLAPGQPSVKAVDIGAIPASAPETLAAGHGMCHRGAPVREMVDDYDRLLVKWRVPK